MARVLPDPFESRLSCRPVVRVRVTGSPGYAFGSGAARRLGVRAAVRSAPRRFVGATLLATDDLGEFLLVERPQGLLGEGQLLLAHDRSLDSGCAGIAAQCEEVLLDVVQPMADGPDSPR